MKNGSSPALRASLRKCAPAGAPTGRSQAHQFRLRLRRPYQPSPKSASESRHVACARIPMNDGNRPMMLKSRQCQSRLTRGSATAPRSGAVPVSLRWESGLEGTSPGQTGSDFARRSSPASRGQATHLQKRQKRLKMTSVHLALFCRYRNSQVGKSVLAGADFR